MPIKGKSKPGADIRGFFKPRAVCNTQPRGEPSSEAADHTADMDSEPSFPTPAANAVFVKRAPLQADASAPAAWPSSSSPLSTPPDLSPPRSRDSSSPSLPPLPPPSRSAPLSASRVIGDSEDECENEDEDEDDEMADLLSHSLLSSRRDVPVPAPRPPPRNPCVTPRAKRTAIVDFSSPMSVRVRPVFDFKTLLAHEDEHKKAMATRAEINDEDEDESQDRDMPDSPTSKLMSPRHITARQRRKEIIRNTIKDDTEAARRAERAMENVNAGSETWTWYFFAPEKEYSLPPAPEFPASAHARWKTLLGNPESRPRHLGSGMPTTIAKMGGVPSEVYRWILQQLPCEPSPICREHYTRILAAASHNEILQVFSDTEPYVIISLFEQLGGQGDLHGDSELVPVREVEGAYMARDWSTLISVLSFLAKVASQLAQDVLTKIGVVALKLAADKAAMMAPGVRTAFRNLMMSVTKSAANENWDGFCDELSQNLFSSIKDPFLQVQVLMFLPVDRSSPPCDLRKRLAAVFLFRDPTLGTQPSKLSLRDFSDRLEEKDFKPGRESDYGEMHRLAWLWEVALDDGGRGRDGKTNKQFNEEIDGLVEKIERIETLAKGGGNKLTAHLQLKEFLKGLASRLQLSIRTRPRKVKDHYDESKEGAAKEEKVLKRQKVFLGKFIGGSKPNHMAVPAE